MQKHRIAYGNASSQYGELRIPKNSGPSAIIVTIHGGFWQSKYDLFENDPICEDLTKRGFATWNIEYRRVGEDGGGWPGTFNDVVSAINHLSALQQSYPINLSNVIIIGHSAGGHLALWLAARSTLNRDDNYFTNLTVPIRKVISLAGVTDLRKMWEIHHEDNIKSVVGNFIGGSPLEKPDRYEIASPMELLPTNIEQVLIHGELDRHVPVELSIDYYEKLKTLNGNVSLTVLKDVEHFKIIDPDTIAWEVVIQSI